VIKMRGEYVELACPYCDKEKYSFDPNNLSDWRLLEIQ